MRQFDSEFKNILYCFTMLMQMRLYVANVHRASHRLYSFNSSKTQTNPIEIDGTRCDEQYSNPSSLLCALPSGTRIVRVRQIPSSALRDALLWGPTFAARRPCALCACVCVDSYFGTCPLQFDVKCCTDRRSGRRAEHDDDDNS